MRLIYTGPHDAVRVLLPGGGETTIRGGDVLDTTDTHARALLEQEPNWRPPADLPRKRASKES